MIPVTSPRAFIQITLARAAKKNSPKSSDRVIIQFGWLGLRFRVRVNFVVRVSGMSTVRVNVWVRVRVSNLLGSD